MRISNVVSAVTAARSSPGTTWESLQPGWTRTSWSTSWPPAWLCTWLDQNILVNQLATCVVMCMVGPEPLGQPVGHLHGYVHGWTRTSWSTTSWPPGWLCICIPGAVLPVVIGHVEGAGTGAGANSRRPWCIPPLWPIDCRRRRRRRRRPCRCCPCRRHWRCPRRCPFVTGRQWTRTSVATLDWPTARSPPGATWGSLQPGWTRTSWSTCWPPAWLCRRRRRRCSYRCRVVVAGSHGPLSPCRQRRSARPSAVVLQVVDQVDVDHVAVVHVVLGRHDRQPCTITFRSLSLTVFQLFLPGQLGSWLPLTQVKKQRKMGKKRLKIVKWPFVEPGPATEVFGSPGGYPSPRPS